MLKLATKLLYVSGSIFVYKKGNLMFILLAAFLISAVLLLMWAAEQEEVTLSIVSMVGTLIAGYVLFDWWNGVPLVGVMFSSPVALFMGLFIYLAIGVIYVVFWYWPEWLESRKDEILQVYNDYLFNASNKGRANLTYESFIESKHFKNLYSASANKSIIVNAIFMWLFDALWDSLHKPILALRRWLFEFVGNALNKTTAKKAAKFNPNKD